MKTNVRGLLVIAALLLLATLIANQSVMAISEGLTEPRGPALLVILRLSRLAFWLSGALVAICCGILGTRWMTENFADWLKAEPKPGKGKKERGREQSTEEVLAHAGQIDQTISGIDYQIGEIQRQRGDVSARLEKIRGLTDDLVRMVKSIAGQAAGMDRRRELLVELQGALDGNQSRRLLEILGELADPHLKTLLQDENNVLYRDRVDALISNEIGALRGRSHALARLIRVWVEQIGEFREDVDSLKQIVTSSEALPTILLIKDSLSHAHRALGINQEDVMTITINQRVPTYLDAPRRRLEGPRSE